MDVLLRRALESGQPVRPAWIEELLGGGLVEEDGCLLLAASGGSAGERGAMDRTGHEAFTNHFHVDAAGDALDDLAVAWDAAGALTELIRERADHIPIRVIVSRDCGSFPNSTVRFHRLRDGEPWLAENLDAYELEALAYTDID